MSCKHHDLLKIVLKDEKYSKSGARIFHKGVNISLICGGCFAVVNELIMKEKLNTAGNGDEDGDEDGDGESNGGLGSPGTAGSEGGNSGMTWCLSFYEQTAGSDEPH